jgi:hypothetical protein
MIMTTKTRAINLPENNVGKQRYDLYKKAYEHIAQSMENGYYLEVITLCESLISDRLESRLSQIIESNYSFKVLGDLIEKIRKYETDKIFRDLVSTQVDEWRKNRNSALHEMIKVEMGDSSTWEDRMSILPEIAKTGFDLVKKSIKKSGTSK